MAQFKFTTLVHPSISSLIWIHCEINVDDTHLILTIIFCLADKTKYSFKALKRFCLREMNHSNCQQVTSFHWPETNFT